MIPGESSCPEELRAAEVDPRFEIVATELRCQSLKTLLQFWFGHWEIELTWTQDPRALNFDANDHIAILNRHTP